MFCECTPSSFLLFQSVLPFYFIIFLIGIIINFIITITGIIFFSWVNFLFGHDFSSMGGGIPLVNVFPPNYLGFESINL